MLNTPHNPTGAVISEDDIKQLRSIVNDTNIIIVSDEVYEHLIFDKFRTKAFYVILICWKEVLFVFLLEKYIIAPVGNWVIVFLPLQLMEEFRKVHQFNCFSCHSPSQVALSTFLKNKDSYLSLSGYHAGKTRLFSKLMEQTRFTTCFDSNGQLFSMCAHMTESVMKQIRIIYTNDKRIGCRHHTCFCILQGWN